MAAASFAPAFPIKVLNSNARSIDPLLASDVSKIEGFTIMNTHTLPVTVVLSGALTDFEATRTVVPGAVVGTVTGQSSSETGAPGQTLEMAAGSSIDFVKTSTFNAPTDLLSVTKKIRSVTPVFNLLITRENTVNVTNQSFDFIGGTVILGADSNKSLVFDPRARNASLIWNELISDLNSVEEAYVLDFLEGKAHNLADFVKLYKSFAPIADLTDTVALTDNSVGTANNTIEAMLAIVTTASVTALRDEINATLLPAIRNNIADLAAKVNELTAALVLSAQTLR